MGDTHPVPSVGARLLSILSSLVPASQLRRVLAFGGLAIVSAIAASAAFFVVSLHESELGAIRNRLEIPAHAIANSSELLRNNIALTLKDVLAQTERVNGMAHPTAALHQLAVELVNARPMARRLELYDTAGVAVISSASDGLGYASIASQDFFKRQLAARHDELTISELIADPHDGQPTIVATRPILDQDGHTQGVAAIYINIAYIQRLLDTLPMPPGTTIALFNDDGKPLVRSPAVKFGDKFLQTDFAHRPQFEAFRNSGTDAVFAQFRTVVGSDRFFAGIGSPNRGFVVAAAWDVSTALAHWRKVSALVVGATVAAIALVIALFAHILSSLRRSETLLAEVSRSEGKFRALMAALPDAVMIVDQSFNIAFANRAAEKLLGYAPGELTGLPLLQTMVPSTRSTYEQTLSAVLNGAVLGSGVQGLERMAMRKDRTELPVEINACPYDSPEGRLLVSVFRDVSRRRSRDEALHRSRENLARAQRIAAVGSFERNLVTGEVDFSDELYRIHGITRGPHATREFMQSLVHPDDRERIAEFRRASDAGIPMPPIDYRIIRPDGVERFLHRECDIIRDETGKLVCLFGTLQDVTERKQIELKLEQSSEKLARAHRIAGIGNFERDLLTGEIEWSEEFLRIWGLKQKPDRGSAELLLSLVHPEDREQFMEGRDAALERKSVPELDFRITRPDGEERVLHREYGVQFDAQGKAVRMFGTIQDVTDRKRIELEMLRSRENLSRAQQLAAMGSFERDLVANRFEWSDELYRTLGFEKDQVSVGYDAFLKLVHPEDRERVDGVIAAELAGTRAGPLECRIIRPDGVERIIRRESKAIIEEGRLVRIYGTLQDITERKKAELELLRSRENLARAQRFAGIGSFERDLKTGQGEWSDEMYRILGLEKRDSAPDFETMLGLVHPDDQKRFIALRATELQGVPTQPFEYRVVRRDGAERIVRQESAVVFDDDKDPIRLYGILQDVTEHRLAERRERDLERQLLHSQKLEALGTLAGGIAHDLNNTLVPIMALSKVTARRFEAGSLVRRNLETIFEASQRACDLVKRVVSFGRKDETEWRDTDIAAVVDEALKLLRATIPSSITLETHIAKVPPIRADASQIHQIVTNLVSNASQAIGGEIGTIVVKLHVRSQRPNRGEICLSVSDTGVGMDDGTQQRIFEPFFTTKPVGKGTGLGLSIVHGIVTSHSGHIEVKSAPGKGTRFDLYFPVAKAATTGTTSSRPAA